MSNQLNTLFAALAGAERIFNILDENIETDDGDVRLIRDYLGKGKHCWKVPVEDGSYKFVPLKGHIVSKMLTSDIPWTGRFYTTSIYMPSRARRLP